MYGKNEKNTSAIHLLKLKKPDSIKKNDSLKVHNKQRSL